MSVTLWVPEPWHYRNWEPVLRHLPDAQLFVEPWSWREQGEVAAQTQRNTTQWLRAVGARHPIIEAMDVEPHVLATLSIRRRGISEKYCRYTRLLYAVTHKDYTYGEANRHYDCVMVASAFGKQRLDAIGVRSEVVGCPKLDDVFTGALCKQSARAALGLDPDRPLVLYAPTFSTGCSLEPFADALRALPQDYDLLMQLHPVSYINERERFTALGERFALVEETSSSLATLVAADVVLTDYSGVIFECCAIDRPVVLLDLPDAEGSETEDPELSHRDAGIRVNDPTQLRAAIESAFEDTPDRRARRAEYRDLFFDHQGGAGRRAAEVLRMLEREAKEARWRDIDLIYNRMRVMEAFLPQA